MKLYNFCLVVGMSFLFGNQNYDWELKKEAEGIEVYTRDTEYSAIKEFRASALISTSAKNVIDVLKNVDDYPLWVNSVSYAKKTQVKEGLGLYYQLEMPWPIKDRDIAMSMEEVNVKKTTTLILNSISGQVKKDKNFVRMEEVKGTWKITPIDNTRCKVTYQFLADPAGNLPSWVINMFLVDGPFETLKNLKNKFND